MPAVCWLADLQELDHPAEDLGLVVGQCARQQTVDIVQLDVEPGMVRAREKQRHLKMAFCPL